MNRLLQMLFWIAVGATLYFTLRPVTIVVPGSDKTHHLITFGLLMLAAAIAYPRARLLPLAAALSGLGAAIEVIQPHFQRTADVKDWIADTAGILIALVVLWIFRRFRPGGQRAA